MSEEKIKEIEARLSKLEVSSSTPATASTASVEDDKSKKEKKPKTTREPTKYNMFCSEKTKSEEMKKKLQDIERTANGKLENVERDE